MVQYREFKGDQWLGKPIPLPGGSLWLVEDTVAPPPGMRTKYAYARPGKKAIVYKGRRAGRDVAFKVFFRRYSSDVNLMTTGQLARFKDVPGLRVCQREVVKNEVAEQIGELGLAFAIVMPWMTGQPWVEFLATKQALSRQVCIALAARTAAVLAGLESRQLAHADISSSNVFIDNLGPDLVVELIDVEDMFHPTFVEVPFAPDGTDGYGHPANTGRGCRNPFGDRFAGGILLAEMLSWHDPEVRELAEEESAFAKSELCQPGRKFAVVRDTLSALSPQVAAHFERLWKSTALSQCPSLSEWHIAIAALGLPRFDPTIRFVPLRGLPSARRTEPRSQTIFVDSTFCTECNRLVKSSRPTDHARTCSHHPHRFIPEFDWSTWLSTPSGQQSGAISDLLKKYTDQLKTCPACGRLVTGADDDAHAPGCRTYQAQSSPPPGARPVPRFDDVSFVSFDKPPARRREPEPLIEPAPPPPISLDWFRPSGESSGPTWCPRCNRSITISGTTQYGHKLTCPNSAIRKFLREL